MTMLSVIQLGMCHACASKTHACWPGGTLAEIGKSLQFSRTFVMGQSGIKSELLQGFIVNSSVNVTTVGYIEGDLTCTTEQVPATQKAIISGTNKVLGTC